MQMLRAPSYSSSSSLPAHYTLSHSSPHQAAGPDPNMVFSYQYQATLSSLLQDYLVDLCREYLPYTANLEIDGVVCLSDGKDLSRQIVLKVHRTLPPLPPVKAQSPWQMQRRDSIEKEVDSKWPRRADLPPKEQIPPQWQSVLAQNQKSGQQSWPINIDRLKTTAVMGSLAKQGSLYGADVPQDLTMKEPGKPASAASGLTPLSALANSVENAPFGSYGHNLQHGKSNNPGHKPAALQPVNKNSTYTSSGAPAQKVVSLLYQKIMEGPKSSSVPMWKSSDKVKLSPQELTAIDMSEGQASPKAELAPKYEDDIKDEVKDEEDDDPSLHVGEMLCKICSESVFGGFYALQNHTYEVHRRYVCKKCFSTFSLRCNLRRHERLHEGLKPYSCDSCEKTFSRSTDLRMHMQKHGSTKEPTGSAIACDKCTKTFTNVQNLRWHMYKVHKSQEELWACTICEQLFSDKDAYHCHRESHTASLNQYQQPKRARMDLEDSGFVHSPNEGMRDDESAMREEYQRELQAIDDEAVKFGETAADNDDSTTELSNLSGEDGGKNNRPCSNPTFAAIKQALANKQALPSRSQPSIMNGGGNSNSRNKRKRKGNPIKHIVNGTESDEEVYDLTMAKASELQAETVNPDGTPTSPVPSSESDADPLQRSYSSDVLASSSMSHFSHISDHEPMDHLQSLQALSQIRSPLVIEPLSTEQALSPLSLPKSSELLYSSHCHSPHGQSPLGQSPLAFNNNNNVEDLSMTGKRTPDHTPDSSNLPPVDDGDDEKEYTCTFEACTEACQGFRAFENHFVSMHSRYPCKLCKQTFSGKNNRTRHMRNHNRAKIYPCPDCGKYFSRPDSMREHRFIHTASYQEDKCRRCGQEFQRKSLLLAHLKNCFRSARTKNGSIDESPYLDNDKTDHSSSFMDASYNSQDLDNSGMRSLGQVDMANLSGSEMTTRITQVPLNIPKVPLLLSENNNEAMPKVVEALNVKNSAVDMVVENLSKKRDEPEPTLDENEEEENSSGNLVIDTSANDIGAADEVATETATATA